MVRVLQALPSLVDSGQLQVVGGAADLRALRTVVVYVEGGVSPVEEAELAAAVDAGTVPYDAVLCGERLLPFGAFCAWAEQA